ncbi:MAG TPA: hypothetical protein VGM64_14570 [Lacunisphaera sp.]|jgi:hypothetical protein
MTASTDWPFALDGLRAALIERRILVKDARLDLFEYPPGFPRLPQFRRWHFRVSDTKSDLCHLIVGRGIGHIHDRAEKMYEACPGLVCRPLAFWSTAGGLGYLCLEHFSGTSLDRLIEEGSCSADTWFDHIRYAQDVLARSNQPSNEAELTREIDALIEQACLFPNLSDFDTSILRGPARALILGDALARPVSRQWSNGDFAGRNLLVDTNGRIRMIDYEYAESTHFHASDWLRLALFSVLPPGVDQESIPKAASALGTGQEIRFWIHHLIHLQSVGSSQAISGHVAETVAHLFRAIGTCSTQSSAAGEASVLLAQATIYNQGIESLANERVARAKLLEAELESRTSWAKDLESELTKTRGIYHQLEQEFNERTAWALSLQKERAGLQARSLEWERAAESYAKERKSLAARADELTRLLEKHTTELALIKEACALLATQIPVDKNTSEICIVEETNVILAGLRQEIAALQSAKNALAASLIDARFRAQAAESELPRLLAALRDAQVHVDGLLQYAAEQQKHLNALESHAIQQAELMDRKKEEMSSVLLIAQNELSKHRNRPAAAPKPTDRPTP